MGNSSFTRKQSGRDCTSAQVLSTRKRKDVEVADIKVQVCARSLPQPFCCCPSSGACLSLKAHQHACSLAAPPIVQLRIQACHSVTVSGLPVEERCQHCNYKGEVYFVDDAGVPVCVRLPVPQRQPAHTAPAHRAAGGAAQSGFREGWRAAICRLQGTPLPSHATPV